MTRLPALERWEPTAHGLHAAARLLGAVRRLVRERVPSYLHLALRVERAGLSTETLPTGGSVRLDFGRAALVYICPAGEDHPLPLAGHSQRSLFEALLAEMHAHGDALATPEPGQPHVEAVMAALASQGFVPSKPDDELTGDLPLEVEPTTSAGYGEALYRVFTALARFRARLEGPQTPAVIWPEHFDLSTLWFPTADCSYNAPQMNFGFAPFDAVRPRPYLYAYAYPMPDGFAALPLPLPASWYTESWRGMVLHYDTLREADDPEALVESAYEAVYRLLAPSFASQ
jgi:hypothetical protein